MSRKIEVEGFNKRVNEARIKAGLTQKECAARCGIERKMFSTKSEWGCGKLARFCMTTDVSADYILGLRKNNFDKKQASDIVRFLENSGITVCMEDGRLLNVIEFAKECLEENEE